MRRNANKRSVSEMVPCSLSLFPPTASFGHLLIAVHCGYCPCFLACVLNNKKKPLKYSEKGAGYTDMTLEQFFFNSLSRSSRFVSLQEMEDVLGV